MATARTRVLRPIEDIQPEELPGPITLDIGDQGESGVSLQDGVLKTENMDGGVTIDLDPDLSDPDKKTKGFYENLVNKIDDSELSNIATNLLEGIRRDEDSRQEWMNMRAKGITLLGLKLEDQNDSAGNSSAPFEGMSRIRHPILLEATVRFQANARSELLPASGPVKVRNDQVMPPKMPPNMPPLDNTPGGVPPPPPAPPPPQAGPPPPGPPPGAPPIPGGMPPPAMGGMPPPGGPGAGPPPGLSPPPHIPPMMGHNGGPSMEEEDDLADALEKDMNHYLTVVATEYVPDTDRMLFYIGFGGDGFKKVFNCPLRRRPVSESVDAEDLIVSNTATDLQNCGRVTHRIKMRKSTLRRMQILGAYRDVALAPPSPPQPTPVDKKKAEIDGQRTVVRKPEDEDYTIYECYCELDLNDFAPKQFKNEGLPLPYRVTIEKDSRKVLSVIRNWDETDEQCLAKRFFVQFPFIRGLGFYGLGFIHLLGNITNTLTAGWRETIDNGMFANFPGFLYSKQVGRQLSNQLRIPPGGGIGLELGAQQDIRAAIMPLPYKDTSVAFTSFLANVAEEGQRLAATAEINVGEGKQDAPVGTTLALIEQATKMLDAVHKRLFDAQGQEFMLLKERFKEDPEAFWRHNKKTTVKWEKEQFIKALDNFNLVPVADPNNPTSLHRMAKATLIKQLSESNKQLYNVKAVDTKILRMSGIDPEGLFNAEPTPPPPDPRMVAITQKTDQVKMQVQAQMQQAQQQLQIKTKELEGRAADRESREKVEKMKLLIETIRLHEEQMMNSNEQSMEQQRHEAQLMMDQAAAFTDMQVDAHKAHQELQVKRALGEHDIAAKGAETVHDIHATRAQHEHDMTTSREKHAHEMQIARERHQQELEQQREKHAVDLEQTKALGAAKVAAAKKMPKPAKPAAKGK